MRRALAVAILLASASARAQFAPQVWTATQDGADNLCLDVHSFQANNMSGGGVQCVHVDNAGLMTGTGSDCGSGGGGAVSSVTGTAAHILASPTTGAVIVDLIATAVTPNTYTYATFTVDADGRLTAASSGTTPEVPLTFSTGLTRTVNTITANLSTGVSGGQSAIGGTAAGDSIAILSTTNATKGEILVGPGGSVAYFDETTHKTSFGQAAVDAQVHFVTANDATPSIVTAWDSRHTVFGLAGSQGAGVGFSYTASSNTENVTFAVPNIAWVNGQMRFFSLQFYSQGVFLGFAQDASGNVYDSVLTSNGLMKTTGGTGLHATATAGTDYQAPISPTTCGANTFGTSVSSAGALTCTQPSFANLSGSQACAQRPAEVGDVTSPAGSCTTTLANIPNDTPMAGDLLATLVAAPAAPAAGHLRLYGDSATLNFAAQTSGGIVNHGIQTVSCSGSQWVSAVGNSGNSTCTQPAFTDVSGSWSCAQSPASTGDVTKASGSCATVVANLPNDVVQAGDILVTNSVAPSTPAAGKTRCYVDSTSKNGACKNDAGTVNHGIQTVSCNAHQWVSAISDAGGSACVQPAFSDISGTATVSQLPTLAFYTQQWSTVRESAFGSLSILNNKQTVLAMANGVDQGFAVTAAGGTAIATTLAANPTNFPMYFTGFGAGYAHASLNVNIMNLVGIGIGTATIVIEVFSMVTDPTVAGNYTSLGSATQSFTSASPSFFVNNGVSLSAIPTGASLVLVVYRSDSAALAVGNGIAFSAVVTANNP